MNTTAPITARYLGCSGAAGYLGISPGTMRRLVDAGKVKAYSISKMLIRFDKQELDRLVHEGTAGEQAAAGRTERPCCS